MPIAFSTQTIADYSIEFVSKRAFKKESCGICLLSFRTMKPNKVIWTHEGSGAERHAHHVECLSPWLKLNNICPCCREENTRPMQNRALTILKKITLNGLSAGLIVGTLSFWNNKAFATADPASTYIWTGNNEIFACGLVGGLLQTALSCVGQPNNFGDIHRTLSMLIIAVEGAWMSANSPTVAVSVASAVVLTSAATICLQKAGATWQGLMPPLIITTALSSVTSFLHTPIPVLPFAAVATLLGTIGALKKG